MDPVQYAAYQTAGDVLTIVVYAILTILALIVIIGLWTPVRDAIDRARWRRQDRAAVARFVAGKDRRPIR